MLSDENHAIHYVITLSERVLLQPLDFTLLKEQHSCNNYVHRCSDRVDNDEFPVEDDSFCEKPIKSQPKQAGKICCVGRKT